MASFLPTQPPGPGPTDAPLPTYQSYSAFTTSIYDYTTTITRIAYDPQGTEAPSLVVQVQEGTTTSIGYSVVNLPLLYTGPFPAPPLGTLFTTAGEVLATVSQQPAISTASATPSVPSDSLPTSTAPTSLSLPLSQATLPQSGATQQPIAAPQPVPTASPQGQTSGSSSTNGNGGGNGNVSNEGVGNGSGSTGGNGGTSNTDGGTAEGSANGSTAGVNGDNGGTQSIQGVNDGEQQPGTSTSGDASNGGQGGDQGIAQASGQSGVQGSNDGSSDGTGSVQGANGQSGGASSDQSVGQNGGSAGVSSSINPGASAGPGQGQATPAPTAAPTSTAATVPAGGSTGAAGVSASEASSSASEGSVAASSASASASAAGVSASNLSVSAESASVSASSAAASASSASVAATDPAQSASASLASASAASAQSSASSQSVSASLASESAASAQSSASAQSASASSMSGSASSASNSLATATPSSTPTNPSSAASQSSLSGGQIAGIVLGSVFALLLLLLLCILCARRRRRKHEKEGAAGGATRKFSDKWPSGFSRGGRRGEYAALGAAGAAAGAGGFYAAGAGRRGSVRSDEWEEDHLSGGDGSGFFVVGGRRLGGRDSHDESNHSVPRSHRSSHSHPASSAAVAGGLAGLGAGIAGAFATRKPVPRSSQEADDDDAEHMITSDEDGDVTNERRGLMSFDDGREGREMVEGGQGGWTSPPSLVAGHSNWRASGADGHTSWDKGGTAAGAGIGAMGAAAMYESGRGREDSNTLANEDRPGSGLAPPSTPGSEAAWLANVPPSYSPPRQNQALSQTYGNIPPSRGVDRIPSFTGGFGDGDLGLVESQQKEHDPFHDDAAILGGAAVAGAGLGALAAGHRESGTSYSSGNGNGSRHSDFISRDTNLLGPSGSRRSSRGPLPAIPVSASSPVVNSEEARGSGTYGSGHALNRLPTIRSVGEFGERSTQASPSLPDLGGTGGSGSGSGTHTGSGSHSGSGTRSGYGSVYTAPAYAPSPRPLSTPLAFSTPFASPQLGQAPGNESVDRDDPDEGQSVARAGLLAGFFPGWTRWGKSEGEGEQSTRQASEQEQLLARDVAVGHQRGQESQGDIAAEVQSQRASVYNNGSTLGHGLASAAASQKRSSNSPRDAGSTPGSGQSSNKSSDNAAKHSPLHAEEGDPYDEGHLAQQQDEDALAAGYSASVSNLSHNAGSSNDRRPSGRSGETSNTGMASTNVSSSLNESSNSSNLRRQRRYDDSSGSTGAASYNPSHLAAPSTSSTRGGGTGTSSSMNSRGAARGGSSSSSSRRHRAESNNESVQESDGQSSRATAGGGDYVPRMSMDRGLESVHEVREEMGTPANDYYPSESLGAAVRRRTEQELRQQDDESPPDLGVPDFPTVPPREPWRPSPRVESLSQRAAASLSQDDSSERAGIPGREEASEAEPARRRGLWDKLLQR